MAAAQLYGSLSAPKRCFVFSNGVRISPSTSRVCSSRWLGLDRRFRNPALIARKLPIAMSVKRNSMTSPGFEANTAIKNTEDHTREQVESDSTVEPVDGLMEVDVEVAPPPKRCAKIHDFCLGIPFGGFLFSMGFLGFLFWRSPISLVLGVAPGVAILSLGVLSLKVWRGGTSSLPFILGQAAVAALLTWKYSQAYFLTKKILPWGFYAFISAAMICFYSYVLLAGGNPPPKKLAATPSS
ncbi:protein FATTY ACID EXPORT 1, chloroplastic isoform X2 [Typha angustifolia]|uniref:protein FATTY ACID EXPORT 1, chloroplastic isoform X2 n=1 Tax=Typha angustifolia TaxID=59011 RepID=UPI003C2E63AA